MGSVKRIAALEIIFSAAALIIVGRAAMLQFVTPPKLERLADRQFTTKLVTLPRRGMITDRDGEGLAVTLRVSSLYMRPKRLKETYKSRETLNRVLRALSHVIQIPASKLSQLAHSKKNFVWLKRQLTPKEETLIKELALNDTNDGLGLAEESKRAYPKNTLAAHLIGAVNIDGDGIEGLELFYNDILAGEKKRISSQKDARGRAIFLDDKGLLAFTHGQGIELTIDNVIQYHTEKTLKNYVQDLGATSASAIVTDVETGEILALANYPTYNPNQSKTSSTAAKRNRAITDMYEPGSVLKPLLTALALERGKKPTAKIFCENGQIKIGKHTISEAEAHEKFEWLTLGEIIKHSSNVGSAKLAMELGPDATALWLKKLGFSQKTGLDAPGESSGFSTTWKSFEDSLKTPITLANVGFGHGITATPIQILSLYSAIANQGRLIKPRLVKRVLGDHSQVVHEFNTPSIKSIMSPTTAQAVTQMLEMVVAEGGTGTKAALDEWSVAGKTGTSQKIDSKTKHYSKTKYITSFAGFAPAKQPKLAAIVVIDEPTKGRYYAGDTAAPAFKDIMRAALMRRNITPDLTTLQDLAQTNKHSIRAIAKDVNTLTTNNTTDADANTAAATNQSPSVEISEGKIRIPNMSGLTMREALKLVSGQPVQIEVLGSGILKKQYPAPEEWLEPRSRIRLIFEP